MTGEHLIGALKFENCSDTLLFIAVSQDFKLL